MPAWASRGRALVNWIVGKTFICQGGAVAAVSLAAWLGLTFPVLPLMGVIAALVGWRLGLARGWIGTQFVLPFAVAGGMALALPAYVWLSLFALTLAVFWNSSRGGVPLYLSNNSTWAALAGLLPEQSGIKFIDLGGGLGGTALYLAAHRPDGQFVSVESAPIPYAISWLRQAIGGRSNVAMTYGDMWQQSLTPFDVVYAFLSPRPMPDLYRKARAEMRPGTLLISNSFDIPERAADDRVDVDDSRQTQLHIWKF